MRARIQPAIQLAGQPACIIVRPVADDGRGHSFFYRTVEAVPMQIHFPNEAPEYSGRELTLAFPALVNGERVQCHITAEALEDHFGAASPRFEDMVGAFDMHRERIEAAARRLLSETRAQCVILRSGYVRFYEANWR